MEVRRLVAGDAEAYRLIRLATLRTEPAYFGSLYEDEVRLPLDAFRAVVGADTVFGAYDGPEIVGVARLRAHDAIKERHKASVHGVFVRSEYRGRGVGFALLSTVIEAARPSFERLVLSVAADNVAAIALYEKLGFKTFGTEPRARKYQGVYTDIVSMGLQLPSKPQG